MYRIAIASLGLLLLGGCSSSDAPEHTPWFGYATHIQRNELEFWWKGFKTHRDCIENMKSELAGSPNNEWYKAPYGCGYSGNSRPLAFILNWIYVGSDLYCVARSIAPDAEKTFSRYNAVVKTNGNVASTKSWYCLSPFEALF